MLFRRGYQPFFYAVVYGLMQNKLDESKTPSLNNVEEVLGRDLF